MPKLNTKREEDLTLGLIESLIITSKVLRKQLKTLHYLYEERYRKDVEDNYLYNPDIYEALKELHEDEDLLFIMQAGPYNGNIITDDGRKMMDQVAKTIKYLKETQTKNEL